MLKFFKTALFVAILTVASYSHGYANSADGARDFVNSTAGRVEVLLKQHNSNVSTENQLNAIFADVADIEWIGKFVLGKGWQTLNGDQKIQYLQQYKRFLFSSYVPLFRDYNGQKFDIKGSKNLSEDQYLVSTSIRPTDDSASPVKVEYRLKYVNGSFKMRDIIAEGISMIATQRSEFSSIMNEGGYEALMAKLRDKSSAS